MPKSKVESWLQEMEREASTPEDLGVEATVALVPSNEEALAVLWAPQPADTAKRTTVEDILVAQGKLDGDKLLQARSIQSTSRGKKMSQILHEMAAVSDEDIQKAVAQVMGLEYEAIDAKKLIAAPLNTSPPIS